jgi:hypothetical protein
LKPPPVLSRGAGIALDGRSREEPRGRAEVHPATSSNQVPCKQRLARVNLGRAEVHPGSAEPRWMKRVTGEYEAAS